MEIKTIRKLYVFISCPDDVKDKKQIVKEVCGQLTETLRSPKGIEIIPVDWEEFIPEIAGEYPQTVPSWNCLRHLST